MKRSLYAAVFLCAPAFAQQAAVPVVVPDPRLEPLYQRTVIAEINRSVMFERTIPVFVGKGQPVVNEQDMVRIGDSLFIERSLLPPSATSDDPAVVRIFRRDAR
jgi:hypothetical protein